MKELVTSRLSTETKRQLARIAEQERRSLSLMVEILLEEAMKAREGANHGRNVQ